jgi:N-acetylmuramoyl-L-alanine amidase
MTAAREGVRVVANVIRLLLAWTLLAAGAAGDDLAGLARLDPEGSVIADHGQGLAVDLALSQPVPYRVAVLDQPMRLIVDFHDLDFGGVDAGSLGPSDRVVARAWGRFAAGWSRMVLELDIPLALKSARLVRDDDGSARLELRLLPTTPEAFAEQVRKSRVALATHAPAPAAPATASSRQTGDRPLRVVLDPGHGGIDPGAEAGGQTEAALMLSLVRDLADALRRAGMEVVLTREADVFVPLEDRISQARLTRADLFLSLHADALEEGEATGATLYLMDETASDEAASRMAERHDRGDILAGVDLTGNDDEVALVLMDLARTETRPRARRFAAILADSLAARGIAMHRRPIQSAAFSVLKAADIPSLLVEVGFLSSARDRARIADPGWRADFAASLVTALQAWAIADAVEARLIRH